LLRERRWCRCIGQMARYAPNRYERQQAEVYGQRYHEESRSHHQALQARRREGGASRNGCPRTIQDLEQRGIGFRSLTESIDTTTTGGRLVFHIFGALAEFERNLIRERTKAGLAAARLRGRVGGRPRSISDENIRAAKKLLADGTPPRDVANIVGVSVPTLYRWLPASKSVA
jgi:DNA invertase Pin-like site-specific DNA recombinase